MTAARILKPGSTIGMLGGGQLGRMAAMAAARLGYHVHVYAQDMGEPAVEVCSQATIGAWDDQTALSRFAASADVITLEFENVPVDTVTFLAGLKTVHPGIGALSVAQDRIAEKTFMQGLGIRTARWAPVRSSDELRAATSGVGMPAILKSARLGYDGKGQVRITNPDVAEAAWASLGRVPAILEGMVAFDSEISVVLARGQDGTVEAYPAVQNIHDSGILSETIAPAPIDQAIAVEAGRLSRMIAEALDYVGVLAVEFFVCGTSLLVNEIAPRPHNSGHWTIDACYVSQFEQQVRAVAGLPLGTTARHSNAVMVNLIGEAALDWQTYLADPGALLHLYGKSEIRAGRKMGHVTRLSPLASR
jgi:5-(carboxyamino)imidazole ribonucleotide synthase